jgi:regulator of RNase E activity RraA
MLLAGNCRDTQYVLKMPDFLLFSFGTGRTRLAVGDYRRQYADLPAGHITHYRPSHAGDWIFGDNDGVQVIPGHLVDEVLLRVEATYEFEIREREQLATGMPIDEVYRTFECSRGREMMIQIDPNICRRSRRRSGPWSVKPVASCRGWAAVW